MTHGTRWLHVLVVTMLLLAALGSVPAVHAAATTFYVTTTRDLNTAPPACNSWPGSGVTPCSLRQAIQKANTASSQANPVTIKFAIDPTHAEPGYDDADPTAITWTITPTLPLPGISGSYVTVDGTTQGTEYIGGNPNQSGPEIILDGSRISTSGGLTILSNANHNLIRGFGIIHFGAGIAGVQVDGDDSMVLGNYIGIDKYGRTASPNQGPGVWITSSGERNTVGGDSNDDKQFNTISGNNQDGIFIQGTGNFVRGNNIGTDRFGAAAVPNKRYGVYLFTGANGNIIGTDANSSVASFRNLISGNYRYGIYISDASGNGVYGNYIGVDNSTNRRLPNGTDSVSAPAGSYGGVQIGSNIAEAADNMIGGPGPAARNLIVGNIGPGVNIFGKDAHANTVSNNYIGLTFNGSVPGGGTNQTVGVLINIGANDNTIGGNGTSTRNVISGNNGDGVHIEGNNDPLINAESWFNNITSNYIGVAPNGSTAIPNAGSGVYVGTWASFTRIGGPTTGEANLIASNGQHGVILASSELSTTNILRNQILANTLDGVRVAGSSITNIVGDTIQGNGRNGVATVDASYTTIAGESSAARSSITGNAADGINATGGVTLTVQFVDTTPVGSPNGGDGADISLDSYTRILSSTLSNNRGIGVRLAGSSFSKILGLNYTTRTEISQNEQGGVLLTNVFSSTLDFNEISRNGSDLTVADGLVISGTSQYIEARGNNASENRGVGVRATGARFLYYGVTQAEENGNQYNQITGNRQGGFQLTGVTSATLRFNRVNNNYNDGVRAENGTNDVVITRNFVQSNGPQNAVGGTCASLNSFAADARAAVGQGVSIRNGTGQTRRVQLLRNLFGQNCGLAILREPNGSALTDANEGIQPPTDLGLTKLSASTALVSGRILIAGAGRCDGCTVELYEADSLFKPDGEGRRKLNTAEDFIRTFDEKGNFSLTLNRIPAQLLATATDKNGNTSEFVAFTARYGIDIEPNRAGLGYPTQVITYYHTVTNSGNVGDSFQLSAKSTNGWKYSLLPPGTFQLLPSKSIPVTVTLTLPAGSVPQVRAGLIEQTFVRVTSIFSSTITDYVTDTTTVQPKVVISVSPLNSTAEITATATALHTHQITNNGNITATLTLSASSLPFWATTISTTTLTLVPGQSQAVIVGVTAPAGTQAGTAAQTTINLTVPSDTSQNKVLTDITRVVVTPRVIIRPPVANGDGAADKVTTYTDFVVINNSNGSARFRLVATSTFGAVVGFRGIGGVTLDANNRFTLGIDPQANPSNALQLAVDVRLPRVIPTGAVDVVTIQVLDDATGVILGTAQARTTVRSGRTIIYMPLVRKTV